MKTVQSHFNSSGNAPNVSRSVFDRSHSLKTTFTGATIVPVYIDEALPGDTFKMKSSMFVRKQSSIVPAMDIIKVDVHYFAVPIRLVWANFKKFMGEQTNPADSTSYVVPTFTVGTAQAAETLFDYMGLPTEIASAKDFTINTLPFRCYNLI